METGSKMMKNHECYPIRRGVTRTLKINYCTWIVNANFCKIQDRLGTEKEAAPLPKLVHSAWNMTVVT